MLHEVLFIIPDQYIEGGLTLFKKINASLFLKSVFINMKKNQLIIFTIVVLVVGEH